MAYPAYPRILSFASVAFLTICLTACTSIGNTFSGGTSDINDTYYAEFSDIPVPREMSADNGSTEISDHMGQKIGYMRFSGSIEIFSLQDAMAYNMHKQSWSPLSIFKSKNGVMVFEKGERVCIIAVSDSFPSNVMRIWVTPKMHGFVVPPSMPVSPAPVEPIENHTSGTGGTGSISSSDSYSPSSTNSGSSGSSGSESGSSVNEQGLSE